MQHACMQELACAAGADCRLLELRALLGLLGQLLPSQPRTASQAGDPQRSAPGLATDESARVLLRLAELVPLLGREHTPDGLRSSLEGVGWHVGDVRMRLGHCIQICHDDIVEGGMAAGQV